MSSSSFSSPATSRRDYSTIESDLSHISHVKSKTGSSFLTSTQGSKQTSNAVTDSTRGYENLTDREIPEFHSEQNPFLEQEIPEYERIRRLMHQVKKAAASGLIEDQVFHVEYKELKSMYLEALSEVVSQNVGAKLM